jgi:hypothetical protein
LLPANFNGVTEQVNHPYAGRMHANNSTYRLDEITYFARANFRNKRQEFGIFNRDRFTHFWACGKSGSGKSSLLLNLAISDIKKGFGCAIIDPHSDLIEDILKRIPRERIKDVIYFNPADADFPISFNLLTSVPQQYHHLVASGLISTFRKMWSESYFGPRMEHIMRMCLMSILENGNGSLLDIQPLLTDKSFRKNYLLKVKTPQLLEFWYNEFESQPKAFQAEAIAPVLNKVSLFSSCAPLRNMVGQKTRSFYMQKVMDEGKILLVNANKALLGEDACALIGGMILSSIQLSALMRSTIPQEQRRPFYLFVDEAQVFVSQAFCDVLSECRKFRLSLFLCNQFASQYSDDIRSAIIGNVGTMACFRLGSKDAKLLKQEFHPTFNEHDLINLPRFSMYVKLMIDGATSKPFSADSLPPPEIGVSFRDEIIRLARETYGRKREEVEKEIGARYRIDNDSVQHDLFTRT